MITVKDHSGGPKYKLIFHLNPYTYFCPNVSMNFHLLKSNKKFVLYTFIYLNKHKSE